MQSRRQMPYLRYASPRVGMVQMVWGLADAAGFYDDIVEALHLHEFIYLLHKVGLEGAADASVLQGHQTVVLASDDSSLLDKVRINVDLSYIIDYYGKPYSFPVGKNVVDEGRLSASEITGQKQDRNCLFFHRVISPFPGLCSNACPGIQFKLAKIHYNL